MKFGISVSTFPTSFGPIMFSGDLETKVKTIADLGYAGLDLFIKNAGEPGIGSVISAIQSVDLEVFLLAAVSAFVDDGLYLSSPQDDIRKELIRRMKSQIDLADGLGAMVPIGVLRGSGGGPDRLHFLAESLFELYEYTQNSGVKLLIEPVNRNETNLINSVEDALEFIETFGLPKFDLLVDIYHMNIEEPNIAVSLQKVGTRIGHVHLADSNRRVPGKGKINWEAVFHILQEIGYVGSCSIEAIPGSNAEDDARFSFQYLQKVIHHTRSEP
jgi:sugar phosphate isomerase/epimerase